MNLLEYREMKAQELAEQNSTTNGEQANAQTQQVSTDPVQPSVQTSSQGEPVQSTEGAEGSTQPDTSSAKPNEPQVFEINGQQVTLDELQRGYLRQSDYTRKTQDVAKQARELEQAREVMNRVRSNPEIAQSVGYDPVENERALLEAERYDLMLQQEVNSLSTKYADFEVSEVLDFALERKLNNLEDAYLLNKQYKQNVPSQPNTNQPQYTQSQPVDVEALKAQLRAELLAEQNTSTLISTQGGSAPTTPTAPQLSEAELRTAKAMRMSPEEYAKWR